MGRGTDIFAGTLTGVGDATTAIAANIGKSQADGTKSSRVAFSSVVSGGGSGAGGITSGTKLAVAKLNESRGRIYTNDQMPGTFFAVSGGHGKTPVRASNDNNAALFFTDLNDFVKQADGTYRNSAGFYLCGINYDANGNPPAGGNSILNLKVIETPSIATTATATSKSLLSMKLPAAEAVGNTATFETTIIDSLGGSHQATYTLTKQTSIDSNQWNVTNVALTNGGTVSATPNIPIIFDTSGKLVSINGAGVDKAEASFELTFDFSGTGANAAQNVSINVGTFGEGSTLTQNGEIGSDAVVYYTRPDGSQPSEAIGTEVGEDGTIYTRFAGSSTLRPRGQILLAVFGNANELGDANGSTYTMKVEAGALSLQVPSKGSGGTIVPQHLEKSTVDATQEYVKMLEYVNFQGIILSGLQKTMEADKALTRI